MKRIAKLIFIIFIVILFFEFIAYVFKTSHNIQYEVKDGNNNFSVKEVYKNKKYYFLIKNKNYRYSFEVSDEFHKRKRIITKIIDYKLKDMLCIYPVIEESNDTNIMCSKDNNIYSYTYYKSDLKSFMELLKDKGYKSNSWKDEDNHQTKMATLKIYNENINDNTYIFIYKYNGFYSINKNNNENIKLFKDDNYNNTLGTRAGRYYIVPNYDQKYDYKEFYVIDMKTNKVKTRTYKNEISKDSYVNGVIDNEIYIFDKDELKQYKIYKKGKKQKEVGNKEDGVLYYDLGFKRKNAYTFRDEEMIFKTFKDYVSQISEKTSLKYITNNKDTYYFQDDSNNIYYYNIHNKQKVLLFNKKISDFILIENTIYFISNDTFYSYSITDGLKKLVTYSELEFNPKNRIAIYSE